MPATSSEDRLTQVTQDLIEVLKTPHPKTPFLDQGDKTSDAMRQLQTIFKPPTTDETRQPHSFPRVQEPINPPPRVYNPDVAQRRSPRVEAMKKLKQQQANNVASTTPTIPLPPHFVNSVYDDETGKMLEFRHLLNHSNPVTR